MLSDDVLPQPYRLINKIVQRCVSDALEEIGKRLNQGAVVGKTFQPLRTTPTVSSAEVSFEVPNVASEAALHVAFPNIVAGLDNGSVQVHNTAMGMLQHSTPKLFRDGEGPIIAVHGGTPFTTTNMFAAASANSVVVFTFDLARAPSRESGNVGGRPISQGTAASGEFIPPVPPVLQRKTSRTGSATPAAPVSRSNSATGSKGSPSEDTDEECDPSFRVLCTMTIPDDVGSIQRMTLSPDGAFLAAVVNGGSTVCVFELPQTDLLPAVSTASTPQVSALDADGNSKPTAPTATLMATVKAPSITAGTPFTPEARCAFLITPGQSATALGYAAKSLLPPVLAHTLIIGWVGHNAVTKVSLRNYTPDGAAVAAKAKQLSEQAFAGNSEQKEAAASATGKDGGKDKGGKGGKGNKGNQEAAPDMSSAMPPPQEGIFDGTTTVLTPQIISALAVDEAHSRVAIGCLDGIVEVFSGHVGRVTHIFNEAPHRETQRSINVMSCKALQFQGANRLIVGHEVPNVESRSVVAVYDLENNEPKPIPVNLLPATTGPNTTAAKSSKPAPSLNGTVKRQLSAGLKGHRASVVQYVDKLHSVVPCGQLPLFLLNAKGASYFVDSLSGAVIGKVEATDTTKTLFSSMKHNDPTLAFQQAAQTCSSCTGFDANVALMAFDEETKKATCYGVSCDEAVFVAYPLVAQAYRACSLEQLVFVLENVPPPLRDNYDALTNVQLPNLALGGLGKKPLSSGSSRYGAMTEKSVGGNPLGGSNYGTKSYKSESRLSAALSASTAPSIVQPGPDATVSERVRASIDARDATRALRAARLKQEWEASKAQLR